MISSHPLLERLDAALRDIVAPEPVAVRGEWSASTRRMCQSRDQSGSGFGPYAEVVDSRWRGTLTSSVPLTGIAFLMTTDRLYWAKAPQMAEALPLEISLHADPSAPSRATFAARVAGAWLPAVPISTNGNPRETCALGPEVLSTGRITTLARADAAAFQVVLLPRAIISVGRKRLWRVRGDVAAGLSPDLCELLTRRRTGEI